MGLRSTVVTSLFAISIFVCLIRTFKGHKPDVQGPPWLVLGLPAPRVLALNLAFHCIQHRLSLASDSFSCNEVQELGFQRFRRVVVANLDPCSRISDPMKGRFDHVVRQRLADAERVLWQNRDNLFHRDNFDVLLNAGVLSAQKVALIRSTRFAKGFP